MNSILPLAAGLILLTLLCSGCEEGPPHSPKKLKSQSAASDLVEGRGLYFPPNAENINHLNEHWATFDLDGETYLIHRSWYKSNYGNVEAVYCFMGMTRITNNALIDELEKSLVSNAPDDVYRQEVNGQTIIHTPLGPVLSQ